MPELPEVEVVRRKLKENILNLTIKDIDVRYDNIIMMPKEEFIKNIVGKSICDIKRLGKYLIINLNEGNIISHLRMEGRYYYLKKDIVSDKHIHVIFYLSNGYMLCYKDTRKFGRMVYKTKDDLYKTPPLSKIGYDPLLTECLDKDLLLKKINKKSISIKTTLLDQELIAGLGNIYVDEVLFLSNINPHTKSNMITLADLDNILKHSKDVFLKSIEYGGTTIKSYESSFGESGHNQDNLLIHNAKICPICKSVVVKEKINGRMTYYCPNCQK